MNELDDFRAEVVAWLIENRPPMQVLLMVN